MNITKISDTQYQEVTPQPDLVVVKSLDDLNADLANAQIGLQNNQDGVTYFTQLISDLQAKISAVQALGVKIAADLVATPVNTEPPTPMPVESLSATPAN